jgi:hypothetical protein
MKRIEHYQDKKETNIWIPESVTIGAIVAVNICGSTSATLNFTLPSSHSITTTMSSSAGVASTCHYDMLPVILPLGLFLLVAIIILFVLIAVVICLLKRKKKLCIRSRAVNDQMQKQLTPS